MKILIITPHYFPENFKVNDMSFELCKRGHDVTVMTPIPDYPEGKFYRGYNLFKKRREVINGVKVHRSCIIPRHSGSSIWLALNYLSYTFFATIKSFWFGLSKKYDTIIVHEPSPILVGIPAVVIKKLQRIPINFWVLDLWPESLSAAGGIRNKTLLGVFESLTKWIYRNSKTILIGSKGYRKSINMKGNFDDRIKYFPNWVEDNLKNSVPMDIPDFPKGFNVLIAGNMGDAQDLPHVMEAARLLKGKNINFIFVGDGRKKDYVVDFAQNNDLESQIICFGRFPLESMPSFFKKADILFMALKDVPIFSMTVPSRLQAYMSSGKPVVAMINGEGADLIKDADCGWSVRAEDSNALAVLLLTLSKEDKSLLDSKGLNGKQFSEKHFDFQKSIDCLEEILNKK